MDGHIDAVSCMAKNPNYLKGIFSGSMDGGSQILLPYSCPLTFELSRGSCKFYAIDMGLNFMALSIVNLDMWGFQYSGAYLHCCCFKF